MTLRSFCLHSKVNVSIWTPFLAALNTVNVSADCAETAYATDGINGTAEPECTSASGNI